MYIRHLSINLNTYLYLNKYLTKRYWTIYLSTELIIFRTLCKLSKATISKNSKQQKRFYTRGTLRSRNI